MHAECVDLQSSEHDWARRGSAQVARELIYTLVDWRGLLHEWYDCLFGMVGAHYATIIATAKHSQHADKSNTAWHLNCS